MKEKVTIYDIAEKLNLSTTTVFRAINNKPRVSNETKQLVIEAAERMGYRANKVAKSLARNTIKLGFIMGYSVPVFHDEIIRGVKEASNELVDFKMTMDCHVVTNKISMRQEILEKMKDMGYGGYRGILLLPSPDMRGYHELIHELALQNVSVALLGSDITGRERIFSLRQDGIIAGKIAAELLWWFTNKKNVAIFTGYKDIGIHAEVIDGFYKGCKQLPLNILNISENQDDPELACYNLEKVLRLHPNLEGIYINTANSLSVCEKLKDQNLGGTIKVVASDIFPELVKHMKQGIVHASIFQDPFNQGRQAVKYLYRYSAEGEKCNTNILIRPQIVLESNLDSFLTK